jgi:uncharacterized protein (DUF111 family)
MVDDGITGERVTPTGAAILLHLQASQDQRRQTGILTHTGHGLGTRELKGCANMVRLLAFDTDADASARETNWGQAGEVGVISFEVDDQAPEDLAVGIETLRSRDGVLDVVQSSVMGKKGRLAVSVRVLCRVEVLDPVIEACFLQTTTIGLRWRMEQRVELRRENVEINAAAVTFSGKTVKRPDGRTTTKVDMDVLALQGRTQQERARARRLAEENSDDDA